MPLTYFFAAAATTAMMVSVLVTANRALDNAVIVGAATRIHEDLMVYRSLHCDKTPGDNDTSTTVLADDDVYPDSPPDPALGLFTWSYRAGDNGTGFMVVTHTDAAVRSRVQLALGGEPNEALNELVIALPRTRAVSSPHFAHAVPDRHDYTVTPPATIRCL